MELSFEFYVETMANTKDSLSESALIVQESIVDANYILLSLCGHALFV